MEQANETVGTANKLVDFGEAIKALKAGKMVRRTGWGAKDSFIFRQVPSSVPSNIIPKMTSLPNTVKKEFENRCADSDQQIDAIYYMHQIARVYPSNIIVNWAPSCSDVFSEDWEILN